MSEVAIFELNSELSGAQIATRLAQCKISSDVSELTDEQLRGSNICQSKNFQVYVPVYESVESQETIVGELERMANILLDVSDGEVFYYRSTHAQEKDADEESISSSDIRKFLPTLHEPTTKRYVLRRTRQSN
jgi:hypothetical protein